MSEVSIYLNEGPGRFHAFDPETAILVFAGTYTFPDAEDGRYIGDVDSTLEAVFREFNIGVHESRSRKYRETYRARSLSVGDVVRVDGDYYAVAGFGFGPVPSEQIGPPTPVIWPSVPVNSRDRTRQVVKALRSEHFADDDYAQRMADDLERQLKG